MLDRRTQIAAAEVVLPCAELDATLRFFTERLGLRIEAVLPADDPAEIVVAGHGVRLRLVRGGAGAPGVLRLRCRDPRAVGEGATELTAPNGTRVELVEADPPLVVPPAAPAFALSRLAEGAPWVAGRAGMRYRELIPGRQGGRYGASHIRIETAGPVADQVHFHRVRFQLIYCYRGWVRVVYEDQGEPFVLQGGDAVLQPPQIRHRVLECSAGLEVIELSCPAMHETWADHAMTLPTAAQRPEREFEGQRFVRAVAAGAAWGAWRGRGFEARDLGIGGGSGGLAGARVVRVRGEPVLPPGSSSAELLFAFVLQGGAVLQRDGAAPERLAAGDCFAMPARMRFALAEVSADLQLLEVACPEELDALRT